MGGAEEYVEKDHSKGMYVRRETTSSTSPPD